MFALDTEGNVVHEFHGLPASRRANSPGRSDQHVEIQKARVALNLPMPEQRGQEEAVLKGLSDLPAGEGRLPSGVRLFIRQDDPGNTHFSRVPVVEIESLSADDWAPLAFSSQRREIDAAVLRKWLVWLYPAGIRESDERKRFQRFTGTLNFEPSGNDASTRQAVLRGPIRLAKETDAQSAFEGELRAVLTYGSDSPDVTSLRAVVEGTYLYRIERNSRQKLRVAVESRPE